MQAHGSLQVYALILHVIMQSDCKPAANPYLKWRLSLSDIFAHWDRKSAHLWPGWDFPQPY